ncbi:hypothetical protein SDC9_147705 [bioreactor metagenome]|uniref:Uncharacterized protein n=1 Tax=bioreactor metagenome TaxID=1076179 RepID=A0A645EGQ9_9ZZZZ
MKLPADLRVFRERLCDGFVDKQRLKRTEPYAADSLRLARAGDRVQQGNATFGEIPPVAREMDSREHDLAIPFVCQHRHLGGDFVQRAGAQRPAREGDNAIGAEVDAAVLNLERRAGTRIAHGGERLKLPHLVQRRNICFLVF